MLNPNCSLRSPKRRILVPADLGTGCAQKLCQIALDAYSSAQDGYVRLASCSEEIHITANFHSYIYMLYFLSIPSILKVTLKI